MERKRKMTNPVRILRRPDPVPISDTTILDLSSGKTTNELQHEAVTSSIASTKIEKIDVKNKKPVSTIPAETSKVTKTVAKSPKCKSRMPLEEIVRELQNTSCNVVKPLLEEKISKNSNVTPDCLTAETSKVTKTVAKNPKRKAGVPLEEIVRELHITSRHFVKPSLEGPTEVGRSNNQTGQLPDDLQNVMIDTSLFASVNCSDVTSLREIYGVHTRKFRADELF